MAEERISPGEIDQDRFDRARRIDWLDMTAVSRARVLMVGAGAIGNEVGKNLVLSGFREITVVDMDRVVNSNLARCIFFSSEDAAGGRLKAEVVADGMSALDENVDVNSVVGTIQEQGEDFFSQFDIVLGCLDNLLGRLHVNSMCCHHRVPYIDGAMDGFRGKVQVVVPPETPCLECAINRSHGRIIEQRFSCTGNDVSLFLPKVGAEITTTSIIGALMVREALKLVCGRGRRVIENIVYYGGMENSMDTLTLDINADCPNHEIVKR